MLNYLHETIDAIPNLVNLMNLKCQYNHILHSCWVNKKKSKQTNKQQNKTTIQTTPIHLDKNQLKIDKKKLNRACIYNRLFIGA